MTTAYPPLEVRVWGDLACFTRPEMKVERVSYPVPTPSAARGILEAIFWRPQFRWRIEEIWVLKPIRYFSVLRNEVNSKASHRSAKSWADGGGRFVAPQDRAQRHTLALRDVDYVIRARMHLQPGINHHPAKYRDQFRRRVRRGRCFSRPYLGCREFAARFAEPTGHEQPIDRTDDIGRMLYDLDYAADGRGTPYFFEGDLAAGILRVPDPPWKEA